VLKKVLLILLPIILTVTVCSRRLS